MNRRSIFLLIGCFIFSILAVCLLYAMSDKINHSKHWGFIRLFPPHKIFSGKVLDVKYDSYYVSGFTSQNVYFGNYTAPGIVLVSNYNLTDTHHIRLSVPENENIAWEGVTVSVDSPNYYMIDRITSTLICGTLGNKYTSCKKIDSFQFSSSVAPTSSSVIMRTYNKQLNQNVLVKKIITTPPKMSKTFVLSKQFDGIFSIDGMLRSNNKNNRIIYLYYYRNQFIVLDSNLSLIYQGQTIDTISTAKIKVSNLSSDKISSISSPPFFVNQKCCISDDWIFVNSGLIANNENEKIFNEHSVIDVYSLVDGKYSFSFYLPEYKNNKMKYIWVYKKTLIAQYDHYMLTYELNF
jgi:hypothetical protein